MPNAREILLASVVAPRSNSWTGRVKVNGSRPPDGNIFDQAQTHNPS